MENFEKAYFVAKEAELWDKVVKATEEYGATSAYTKISRTRWASYYEICKHFFLSTYIVQHWTIK